KAKGQVRAGDGDGAILERLAQHLEHVSRKIGELVEKQDSVMREADFSGARRSGAAANEAGVGDGVMRSAERPLVEQAGAFGKQSADAVDLGGFNGFLEREWRQNPGQPFGEHGLPGTWWTD